MKFLAPRYILRLALNSLANLLTFRLLFVEVLVRLGLVIEVPGNSLIDLR